VLEVESDLLGSWSGWRTGASNNPMGGEGWMVEGKKILANDSEIKIRYIFRNVDYNSWSPPFAEVMSWRIAMNIAYALTQSTERETSCGNMYRAALAAARSTDGAEGTLRGLIADEWTNSRR